MKTFFLPPPFDQPHRAPGFALISVLALVSLAALTATAFLASARLERAATRPLGERVRLEMALNIGMNCAKEIINDGVGSSYDNVVTYWRSAPTNELGYLLMGTPRYANGNPGMYWYAAFSTARMTELATNGPPTNVMTNRITVTNQSMFSNSISSFMSSLTNFGTNPSTNIELIGHTKANPRLSPPVGWITIKQPVRVTPGQTNVVSQPVLRFAFFVEDLSGLIDAERMCGASSRNTGTNPAEISMANIASGVNFGTSSNQRATYLSPDLLAISGGIDTNNLRYFATGLRAWTNAIRRIPRAVAISSNAGYGGATAGDGTMFCLTNSPTVQQLASTILSNLPSFTNRGGAMAGGAYLSNVAANIVDYADADSIPSVESSSGSTTPAWRGVEAIPWPNEVFTRFNLQSRTIENIQGTNCYQFKLGVKQYVEVWNLSSQMVTYQTGSMSISNNMNIGLQCSNWFGNLATVDTSTPPMNENTTNPTFQLPPNSYGVISAQTRTYTINVETNKVPNTTTPMLTINRTQTPPNTNNRYVIFLNGTPVDATRAGRILGITTNLKVGDFHFICSAANFGTFSGGSAYNLAGGDPRAQMFITQPTMAIDYTNSTPGGRNRYTPASGNANIVNPPINWPDGGHSLGANGADVVVSPGNANANNSIPQGLQRQGNTNHWIQWINTNGSFTNIMELGQIFDPIQWGDPNNPFHPRDSAAWMVLSGSCTNFGGAGGRNTLRIGRPEHPLFAFTNLGSGTDLPVPNMGGSAAAFLDIFCVTTNYDNGGRININTAPGAVLSALAGGVSISSDSAKTGSEANSTMVSAFTNGVIKFRQTYPFYSPSQLAFISANYGDANWTNNWNNFTVFSTNTTGGGLRGITSINDRGIEEWFSKIYGLSSVDSHNFRIYVYAQMVNSNNVPYGRVMRKYYHVYAEQTADTPGTAFSGAGYSMIPERESEY